MKCPETPLSKNRAKLSYFATNHVPRVPRYCKNRTAIFNPNQHPLLSLGIRAERFWRLEHRRVHLACNICSAFPQRKASSISYFRGNHIRARCDGSVCQGKRRLFSLASSASESNVQLQSDLIKILQSQNKADASLKHQARPKDGVRSCAFMLGFYSSVLWTGCRYKSQVYVLDYKAVLNGIARMADTLEKNKYGVWLVI